MTILFLHGWQSVPGGVKPTYLKDHGHEVINPKLPDEDFEPSALPSRVQDHSKHYRQIIPHQDISLNTSVASYEQRQAL
jgi:predicted esterase YcpF (UPF0227 family)